MLSSTNQLHVRFYTSEVYINISRPSLSDGQSFYLTESHSLAVPLFAPEFSVFLSRITVTIFNCFFSFAFFSLSRPVFSVFIKIDLIYNFV